MIESWGRKSSLESWNNMQKTAIGLEKAWRCELSCRREDTPKFCSHIRIPSRFIGLEGRRKDDLGWPGVFHSLFRQELVIPPRCRWCCKIDLLRPLAVFQRLVAYLNPRSFLIQHVESPYPCAKFSVRYYR